MIGGELGGPRGYKMATSILFVFLWLFYVLMSSLEAYDYIEGKPIFPDILIPPFSFKYFKLFQVSKKKSQ